MSILNVNQIQPVGSGQTVTISAANITASSSTISASSFVGPLTGDATGLSGSPTLSGITSVSTTNLTVNGNAYPSAGPLSNRNLVINGAMQVWQRGTSSTSNGYQTVDRFSSSSNGGTVTRSQVSLTSGSPFDEGFRYFYRHTNTSGTGLTDGYRFFYHAIEGQDIAQSGWNYPSSSSFITLSFWVRSSVSGTYYGYFLTQGGTQYMYPFEFTLAADTWTKITKTIPGFASLSVPNDNTEGLSFTLAPYWGSDFTDNTCVLDAWKVFASGSRSPDYTNGWNSTSNATFDVTGVQLEVGTVATPFEHRSYGDESARCKRYYQKSFPPETAPTQGSVGPYPTYVFAKLTTSIRGNIPFEVAMRTAPTITLYRTDLNATDGRWSFYDGSTWSDSVTTFPIVNENYMVGYLTTTVSNGQAFCVQGNWTANSEL